MRRMLEKRRARTRVTPKAVPFGGKIITTGIFKQPIEGRVRLRTLNLDGEPIPVA
jgi:hypothetical protein